jgi:hypothetical protein
MRTTLNINDALLKKAQMLTNVHEKTALVNMGLIQLIAKYSQERLVKLAGTEKKIKSVPRRR